MLPLLELIALYNSGILMNVIGDLNHNVKDVSSLTDKIFLA